MAIKLRLILSEDTHPDVDEEICCFDKGIDEDALTGLFLDEAKQLLKLIQRRVVEQQVAAYVQHHRDCPHCGKQQRIKGCHDIQYRTLFGIVTLHSPRLYRCSCGTGIPATFSPLRQWLDGDHVAPKLKYLETKWVWVANCNFVPKTEK